VRLLVEAQLEAELARHFHPLLTEELQAVVDEVMRQTLLRLEDEGLSPFTGEAAVQETIVWSGLP
jgi:hypothetical protein